MARTIRDKEFLHWIMQNNPLDDVDTAYRHPQQAAAAAAAQQQQQHHSSHPPSMNQLSHPPQQQKQNNFSDQRHTYSQNVYEERFSHQQPHLTAIIFQDNLNKWDQYLLLNLIYQME
ncbi:unnamed protein product [Absidia cylindrospora]